MRLIKLLTILIALIVNYVIWFRPPAFLSFQNYSALSGAEVIHSELNEIENEEEIYNFIIDYLNKNKINFQIKNDEASSGNLFEYSKSIIVNNSTETIRVDIKKDNLVGVASGLAMLNYSNSTFVFSTSELNSNYNLILSHIDRFECNSLTKGVISSNLTCELNQQNLINLLESKIGNSNLIQKTYSDLIANRDNQFILKVNSICLTILTVLIFLVRNKFRKLKTKDLVSFLAILGITLLSIISISNLFGSRSVNNQFYFPELLTLIFISIFSLTSFALNSLIKNKKISILILLTVLIFTLTVGRVTYIFFLSLVLALAANYLNSLSNNSVEILNNFIKTTLLFTFFIALLNSLQELTSIVLILNIFAIAFFSKQSNKKNYGELFLKVLILIFLFGSYSLVTLPSAKYPKPTNLIYISDESTASWLTVLDSTQIFQDEFVSNAINYQSLELQKVSYPYVMSEIDLNANSAPQSNFVSSALIKLESGKYLIKPSPKSIKTVLFANTESIKIKNNVIISDNNYFELINLPEEGVEIEFNSEVSKIQIIDKFDYLPTVTNFRPSEMPENITHSEMNGVESGVSYVSYWVETAYQ